jgi:hypothetical protein
MKGNTNIRSEDVIGAVRAQAEKQQNLHRTLQRLAEQFARRGVRFRAAEAGDFQDEILWGMGVVPGCRVVVDDGLSLFAYPLMSAVTQDYMVPRAGPTAADIIYLDSNVMLFMPHGQDPGEGFPSAAKEVFGLPENIAERFPGAVAARLGRHYLELVTAGEISPRQLEELRRRHDVAAVIKGDPFSFQALIHTYEEQRPSLLWDELSGW